MDDDNYINTASNYQGRDTKHLDYTPEEINQGHRKFVKDYEAYKPFMQIALEPDSKKKAGAGLKVLGEAAAKAVGLTK